MKARKLNIQQEKFKVFVRYLIQVAKEKRCVAYYELENVFGLSHEQVGNYAGQLGNYCIARKLPPLNGLIVNSTTCVPSEGFDWYLTKWGKSWGEAVSRCWREFRVTSSRAKQVLDFGQRDRDIDAFLKKKEGKN